MLELMRTHSKNWLIKIILGLVALAMVGFFGLSGVNYFTRSQNLAATVNGEDVTMPEYDKVLAQLTEVYRRQLGANFDKLSPMLNLKRMALEQVIQQVLLRQAADKLGAAVGDQELIANIAATGAFQSHGRFNQRIYERVLAANRLTPESYEQMLRAQILTSRLGHLVAGSAGATPLMLEQAAIDKLTKVKGVYKAFAAKDFLPKMKADAKDLEAYYKTHQQLYEIPEKITVKYLVFPAAKFSDQVKVSQRDIGIYYEIHRDKYFEPAKVKARHILLKLAPDADPQKVAEVKAKAEKLLAEAKKDKSKFAELAAKNSQGPTASQGGDLGYFTQGDMQKSFADAAFALKEGQMGLARTSYGFHVILVEKKVAGKSTPLEEVSDEIKAALAKRGAQERAEAAAETAYRGMASGANLAAIAKANGGEVKETKPFAMGQTPGGLNGADKLFESFSGLPAGSRVPPVSLADGAALCVLGQRLPAHVQPLDKVKDKVEKAVLAEKADQAAQAAAKALLGELAKDKKPAAALAAKEKAVSTDWLERNSEIKGLSSSRQVLDVLFSLPAAQTAASQPVAVGESWLALVLAERQEPGKEELKKAENELRQELLNSQREQVKRAFLSDLRESAEITVNKMFQAGQ